MEKTFYHLHHAYLLNSYSMVGDYSRNARQIVTFNNGFRWATIRSEVYKLKTIVLEQVTLKKTCNYNSSSDCLSHTPDGSDINLTNCYLTNQFSQGKSSQQQQNHINHSTLLRTSKPTYDERKDIFNTQKSIENNCRMSTKLTLSHSILKQ